VELEMNGLPAERVVMDKSCGAPCFDEFLLWLRRNEIHEYSFVELAYAKRDDVLELRALIAPALMILAPRSRRTRGDLDRIGALIDGRTSFRLSVRTLFRCRIGIPAGHLRFPLEVDQPRAGLRSLLVPAALQTARPVRHTPGTCGVLQVFVAHRGPHTR
jgi:hypothetical protein